MLSVDESLVATESLVTDEDIIESLLARNDDAEEDDECDDDVLVEPIYPKTNDLRNALDVLREYMIFSTQGGKIQRNLNKIIAIVDDELKKKLEQTDTHSFFQLKPFKFMLHYRSVSLLRYCCCC